MDILKEEWKGCFKVKEFWVMKWFGMFFFVVLLWVGKKEKVLDFCGEMYK